MARKRRRSEPRQTVVIRSRWKRNGRSIVRQRPDSAPHPESALQLLRDHGLVTKGEFPDKAAFYRRLGYPRHAPVLPPRSDAAQILTTGSAVAYVVQSGDTLASIARTFQLSEQTLLLANPEIGTGERLAAGQVIRIPTSEPAFPSEPRTLIPYVAQAGQSLSTIASMFGVSLEELIRVNPQLGTAQDIFVGQIVWVPTVPDAPASRLPAILFMAQPGDTLGDIGLRFDVTLEEMVAANPQMHDPDLLYPGEIVVVPVSGVPAEPIYRRRRYVVQPGDNLLDIATRFMVSIPALEQANPIPLAIPGLTLVIPRGVAIPAPPEAPPGARPCRPAPFGRRLELGDDDSAFVPFGHDFRFRFYGQGYQGLFVNSNGSVTFGEGDPTFIASVDQFLEGPPRIAPFWTDLNPPAGVAGSGVYVDVVRSPNPEEARVTLTWDRVPYFFTKAANTVQLSLYADGWIQVCYFHVADPPDARRILIGVARGLGEPESNIFRYDGHGNPRRTGNPLEPTPAGNLSGRVIWFRYEPERGNYALGFGE